jgi:glycine cleavage system H protein
LKEKEPSMIPKELKYTKTHEYVRVGEDGQTATVGISKFAAEQLGDIVYLELPEAGTAVTKEQPMGVIESVKAASDLYAPISGEVVETNEPVTEEFDTISADPYGQGWFVKIRLSDAAELDALMTPEQYEDYLASEAADQ